MVVNVRSNLNYYISWFYQLAYIMRSSNKKHRKQLLQKFKGEDAMRSKPPSLFETIIPASHFLDVATCGPSFAQDELGIIVAPTSRDEYASVDVLVCHIAVMSMRYGLDPKDVGQACTFLKQFDLDGLNKELKCGRTFLFIPTNRKPLLVSKDVELEGLAEFCGDHGYPGLLLNLGAFVETVNDRIRNMSLQ
jgi:hypothetical protein